jgi:hypothetical protein
VPQLNPASDIGYRKNEHRLERNRLKGAAGDAINAILAAAAMNFRKLLAAFLRLFLRRLLRSCACINARFRTVLYALGAA